MFFGRRSWLAVFAVLVVVAAAAGVGVGLGASTGPASSGYLSGPFTQKTVDRFVQDFASVGIGVYRPGATTPVRAVHSPVSPMRLTVDQARSAAAGVWSHAGLSGATLSGLAPPVRLSPRLAVPIGVFVAGWAKQVQTPSAALARRILGPVDWRHDERIIFPEAVLLLFASDVTVYLGSKVHSQRHTSGVSRATTGLCTTVTSFVDNTVEAVFKAIGHVSIPGPSGTGFLAQLIRGAAAVGQFVVNTVIDIVHFIVVNGVKVAISAITAPIAAVAGTVAVISQVATVLLPWTGKVQGKPNPTAKGVGSGEDGIFLLTVTAPGSNLEWPAFVADCAEAFHIPLPTLIPSDADVRWNLGQNPAGLIVRGNDSGSLDRNGTAILRFVTTTESAELANKGELRTGAVAAIATVHRKDLDQLADRITQGLLASLPTIIQNTIGSALQSILNPLIDGAKAKIAAVRDIQTSGVENVQFHVPKDNHTTTTTPTTPTTTTPSGFSLTTGAPTLTIQCSGEFCAAVETAARKAVPSYRIQGRTCSQVESTWTGAITNAPYGIHLTTKFSVPSIGHTLPWNLPPGFVSHTLSAKVHATIQRTAARTVVFRSHVVIDQTAKPFPMHAVEDIAFTATITPKTC